jgi:para-aminobenzoate synthetase
MKALIIDNYDSFTFNLYQLVGEITGIEPIVVRNDGMKWEDLLLQDFDSVIISPGPGSPDKERDFGLSRRAIQELRLPIFGVCLGHQGIGYLFGGTVQHAPEPMHGRLSYVYHDESDLFAGVSNPFRAVRYHSLTCADPLPECLVKTAWTEDGIIMGLAHRTLPIWGVQFHPESISTEHGRTLLKNFAQLTAQHGLTKHRRKHNSVEMDRSRAVKDQGPEDKYKLFVRRIPLAVDTADLFTRLFAGEETAFWLDSSLCSQGLARFSMCGGASSSQSETVRYYAHEGELEVRHGGTASVTREDLFSYLNREIARRAVEPSIDLPFDFNCGYVGYFGYELKAAIGCKTKHRSDHPDCALLAVDRCVVVDHQENDVYLLYLGHAADEWASESWFDSITPHLHARSSALASSSFSEPHSFAECQSQERYLENIATCLQHLKDGESYEICLTNRIKAATRVNPFEYYKVLRVVNPAPYSAYLKFPEVEVACSSMERFLKINSTGIVETKPIKGTVRRGANSTEDERLRDWLAHDTKSHSENLMIVDLLRNDLGQVCRLGSVSVPKLMSVESYATVHQLVSTVTGHLRGDQTAVDCLQAAFPGGSMTGAPKMRTMEIIDELEDEARGIYSGSIGYLALNGSADLNIVIRTAVFADESVSIGVGGAIVALSDPIAEWEEIVLKSKALRQAFEQFSHVAVER